MVHVQVLAGAALLASVTVPCKRRLAGTSPRTGRAARVAVLSTAAADFGLGVLRAAPLVDYGVHQPLQPSRHELWEIAVPDYDGPPGEWADPS